MSLPSSRDYAATAASPVLSATTNRLQDCVIGMKWPSHWRWKTPTRGGIETNVQLNNGGGLGDMAHATADNAELSFSMDSLPEGTRITGVGAVLSGVAAGETIQIQLARFTPGAGETIFASVSVTNPPSGTVLYTASCTPYTLAPGESLYAYVTLPKAGDYVTSVGVQIDRL
jgi:hypothetical protein